MKIKFHEVSRFHFWCESRTVTLQTYDLTCDERGEWSCTCEGYFYKHSCAHLIQLLDELDIRPAILPARDVAKRPNVRLEDLFDYSRPPTHAVTRRERVKERW
jgi:hypothetical protein